MKKINNIHTRVIKTTKEVEEELMIRNFHTKIAQEKKQSTNNITNIESVKKDIEQQSSNSIYSKSEISTFNKMRRRNSSHFIKYQHSVSTEPLCIKTRCLNFLSIIKIMNE